MGTIVPTKCECLISNDGVNGPKPTATGVGISTTLFVVGVITLLAAVLIAVEVIPSALSYVQSLGTIGYVASGFVLGIGGLSFIMGIILAAVLLKAKCASKSEQDEKPNTPTSFLDTTLAVFTDKRDNAMPAPLKASIIGLEHYAKTCTYKKVATELEKLKGWVSDRLNKNMSVTICAYIPSIKDEKKKAMDSFIKIWCDNWFGDKAQKIQFRDVVGVTVTTSVNAQPVGLDETCKGCKERMEGLEKETSVATSLADIQEGEIHILCSQENGNIEEELSPATLNNWLQKDLFVAADKKAHVDRGQSYIQIQFKSAEGVQKIKSEALSLGVPAPLAQFSESQDTDWKMTIGSCIETKILNENPLKDNTSDSEVKQFNYLKEVYKNADWHVGVSGVSRVIFLLQAALASVGIFRSLRDLQADLEKNQKSK